MASGVGLRANGARQAPRTRARASGWCGGARYHHASSLSLTLYNRVTNAGTGALYEGRFHDISTLMRGGSRNAVDFSFQASKGGHE